MSGSRRPSQKRTATAMVTRSAWRKLGEAIVRFEKIWPNGTRRLDTKRVSAWSRRNSVSVVLGSLERLLRILSIRRVALQTRRKVDEIAE